jgi:hypothetical protein
MDPPCSGISHPFSVFQRFFKTPAEHLVGRRANLCLALKEGLYSYLRRKSKALYA